MMIDRAQAAEAWQKVHSGMQRFGMESGDIDTLSEYFTEPTPELSRLDEDVAQARDDLSITLDNAVAQVAAEAIRSSFFTSVSGLGEYYLSLKYPTMDAMHVAEDRIKAFANHIRFQPLAVRLTPSPTAHSAGMREGLEEAAKVAANRKKFHLQSSAMGLPIEPSPIIAKDRAKVADDIETAIRALIAKEGQ